MSEIATQELTLYRLTDDISAYFETREMLAVQLADPLEDGNADAIKAQLAEVDAQLARLATELATKTDNIAGVLRRMGVEQDHLKAEQERIHDRRKTFERAEKWLRDYVVSVMEQRGMTQLKTTETTLFLRHSDAVVILDSELIGVEYKNVTAKMPAQLWRQIGEYLSGSLSESYNAVRTTEDISLSTIKKAIKSGLTVDGADVEFHTSLTVR
jgi:hypothetical protein